MIYNNHGVYIPDIPEEALVDYSYAVILGNGVSLMLVTSPDKFIMASASGNTVIGSLVMSYRLYNFVPSTKEWEFSNEITDRYFQYPLQDGVSLLWSNNDIYDIEYDESGNPVMNQETQWVNVSDTVVYPKDVAPPPIPDYIVTPGNWIEGVANYLRRAERNYSTYSGDDIQNSFDNLPIPFFNGMRWEPGSNIGGYTSELVYADGKWVGRDISNLLISTDGKNFSRCNVTVHSLTHKGIAYGNGVWCACRDNDSQKGCLVYSTDGVTWSEGYIGSKSYYFSEILFANGIFVAGSIHSSLGLWYSSDAVNWTPSDNTDAMIDDLYFINGVWFATESCWLYTSKDGIHWTKFAFDEIFQVQTYWNIYDIKYSEKGLWLIATKTVSGSRIGLLYSTDCVNWNRVSNISFDLMSVCYANGLWVGCSENNGLYYSTDGINWTQSNVTSGTFWSVKYVNKLWVAGGSGNGLWYSTDGINWSQSNITSGTFMFLSYDDGIWITSDSDTSRLYYSVAWEPAT